MEGRDDREGVGGRLLTGREATDEIKKLIRVTRADVVAAKTYLLGLKDDHRIELRPESREWAKTVSSSAPHTLVLDGEDVREQVIAIAKYMSAWMSCGAAAWELVRSGLVFQVGQAASDEMLWPIQSGGHRGGISRPNNLAFFPEYIFRPAWHTVPSELFDCDLYLQRLNSNPVHPNVAEALRLSLACFQRDLFVPCVAMLGAASEGAWVELGLALGKRFYNQSQHAAKLVAQMKDSQSSTKTKIDKVCHAYELPEYKELHEATGVNGRRLRSIQQWSDQIRESRNVLHWGATPTIPNTYEKVAILLMDATSELDALHVVTLAAGCIPTQ